MQRDDAPRSRATLDGASIERELAELVMAGPVPVDPTERACCCPSRPAVRVVLPSTVERDHVVDLLLCWHHYRRSLTRLTSMHARVFDTSGLPLC